MRLLSTTLTAEESPLAQEQIESARERALRPLSQREWVAEAIAGGVMLALAVALLLAAPDERGVAIEYAVLLTLALAVAARVEFEVVGTYTAASQVVLVPMLFVLPPSVVPLLCAAALVLARLPEVLRGERPPSRAAMALGDCWFALGPALVLTAAGAPEASDVAGYVLAAALAAQFACDFCSSAIYDRIVGGPTLREQVGESAWIYLVDALLAPLGFVGALAAERHGWALALLLLPLLGLLQLFAAERRRRIRYILELSRAYRGTAALLGDVVEADHSYTGDHSREVLDLSLAVADELGLTPVERRRVEFGALLHDVGKLAVPKGIIDKPGPLDDDEWQIMRRHTIEGEAMLAKVGGVLSDAGAVVRASHEHFDGGGYPDGLRADAIPIEARVVSCCDAFSAMTTDRSYRPARSHAAALAELQRCAGTQFDPAVVDGLVRVIARDTIAPDYERKFARAWSVRDADEGQPAGASL
jgi:putative nucleotidyltransferase with HDIG domain